MAARTVSGRKVRFGVVGGGWISQQAFMPGVGQTSNAELSALVTGDPIKADQLAARYGIKSYTYDNFAELLETDLVDALYVATPNFRHTEFVVPALEAGIHVLLEKPMATSEADCQAMIAAAERSGAKLMIAYRLHFEPGTLAALGRVDAGDLGEPRIFTSTFGQKVKATNHRATSGYWAGPVTDMGPYPINAARHLFKAEPIEVMATGFTDRDLGFHDVVAITLRFPGDKVANFTIDYSGPTLDEYRLIGSKGDIKVSPAFMFGPGVSIDYVATISGEAETKKHPITDQFAGETEYFADCILHDRQPEPDGFEGLMDVRILAALEQALATGRPQKLAPMEHKNHPRPDQAKTIELAEKPEMINGEPPA